MKRKAKSKKISKKQRAKNRLVVFLVLSVLNIGLLIGTLLMLPTAFQTTDAATGETKEWLPVESITVEGNTRYDEEAIIGVSGIELSQSVFSLNKRTATKKIREAFAYVENVSIDISLKRDVTIRVTEAEEMGAVYANGKWVVVSHRGIGLMHLPLESEKPFRRLYLKGVKTKTDEIGKQIIDNRDLETVLELMEAMQANGLKGVAEIDLSNRNDITLNWKNQILVKLGNDSNLTYEIAAVVSAIPKVLSRHGDTATGILNVSQYSDETVSSPMIVFTPSSILQAEKEKQEAASTTGTGSSTAAPTTTTRAR